MRSSLVCLLAIFVLFYSANSQCYAQSCPGDINCDGNVDGKDLFELATDYGKSNCPPPQCGSILVYDADDTFLGILAPNTDFGEHDTNAMFTIFIRSIGKLLKIDMIGDGRWEDTGNDDSLYFESTDCSGQPYLKCIHAAQSPRPEICEYYIIPFNGSYYVTDPAAARNTGPLLSRWIRYPGGNYGCNSENLDYSLRPLVKITLPFDTPVPVPLKLK
jgi:hypothetical protein